MKSTGARYDGHSSWYDQAFSAVEDAAETEFLTECLGAGSKEICLDVACGTGRYGPAIAAAGYTVVGFDISADQLRFARRRLPAAVRADARLLPVRDEAAAVAVGMFFHTDVEDFAAVTRDIARCLCPGGRFIYIGLHPCFLGPFVNRVTESEDLRLSFTAGYGKAEWANRGSGDGSGLGGRVGFHHKTLASFVGALADAGLSIRAVREFSGGGVVLPRHLGIATEKAWIKSAR